MIIIIKTGEKMAIYKCTDCEFETNDKMLFADHQREMHGDDLLDDDDTIIEY
jgi:hypothetical protein